MIYGIAFVLIGLFSLAAGIFNWDWFMNSRRARFFIKLFKRTGTRIFYGLLGIAALVLGVLFMTGIAAEL
jgi:hypothetical protein